MLRDVKIHWEHPTKRLYNNLIKYLDLVIINTQGSITAVEIRPRHFDSGFNEFQKCGMYYFLEISNMTIEFLTGHILADIRSL